MITFRNDLSNYDSKECSNWYNSSSISVSYFSCISNILLSLFCSKKLSSFYHSNFKEIHAISNISIYEYHSSLILQQVLSASLQASFVDIKNENEQQKENMNLPTMKFRIFL